LVYYLFYQKSKKIDKSLRKSRSHLYDARDALAIPHFPKVFSRIDQAREEVGVAQKNNRYSLRDRTEEIEQREKEVEQLHEVAERTERILYGEGERENGIHGFLSDASEYRDENEYEKAVEACSEAIEIAKEGVNKFEQQGYETEAIEDSIAEAKEIREDVRIERDIDAELTKVEGRIEKAESLTGGGSEEEVAEYLDGTWKVIDDCRERAAKRGFAGLVEKAEGLRKRRSKVRDAVSGEGDTVASEPSAEEPSSEQEGILTGGKVPSESVPSSPATEVGYKDLEKGDRIGKGGQADVFLAFAPDDTAVALKEPRFTGTLHSEVVEGFTEEAETWGRLDSHDGVVSVFNYGTEPLPWIAMEYMAGGELGDRTEDMSLKEKLWTATRIADAVWHAHRRGVAHLDLKPGNILFKQTEQGYYDIPKVSDWGLAKVLLKHSKSIDGLSVNYSAPEQFDPDEYGTPDDRTDIYQLGAVFYEMFTGRPPFEGGNSQVMYSVLNEEPKEPTRLNHELPPELDAILIDALAKDRDDRYESVVYLRDELRELL
jgi:tetratricopeptide (TPR) repeat protein